MKIANLVVEGKEIRRMGDILYNQQDESYQGIPYIYSTDDVTILMREKYYMRISSTLMTVIILKFIDDNKVEIEIVISGGKEGLLMLSWGAEKSENVEIVYEIKNICSDNSWDITSMVPENLLESVVETTINKIKEKVVNPFKKS